MTEEGSDRSVGQRLKQARENAGLQISDLAATTRINSRYIEALEEEAWDTVPGSVIGRGFVRMLARELGLDPGPLVAAYRAARGEEDATPEHALPEADWDVSLHRGQRRWPLLVAVVAVFLVLAGVWYWWRRPHEDGGRTGRNEGTGISQPVASPSTAAFADPIDNEEAEEALRAPAQPEGTEESLAAEVGSAPAPDLAGSHRLGIQAVEKVWVRVRADDDPHQDRLLQPGELVEYEAQEGFAVKLGNAGSVRLSYDGDALQVPGNLGEVKTLQFPADLAALRP